MSVLEVANLAAGYGRAKVLFDVSIRVGEGEAVALVGPNGAGKTTLLGAILGFVRVSSGTVRLRGLDISKCPPHKRVRMGLGLVPSGRALFGPLSVEKNLQLGLVVDPSGKGNLDMAYELFPELAVRRRQRASTLSGGEQQMVAIARALLGKPSILMLDEPSLGLAPIVTERVYNALTLLKERGQTILLVEEKTEFALAFADRYIIVHQGRVTREGSKTDVLDETVLGQSYID